MLWIEVCCFLNQNFKEENTSENHNIKVGVRRAGSIAIDVQHNGHGS